MDSIKHKQKKPLKDDWTLIAWEKYFEPRTWELSTFLERAQRSLVLSGVPQGGWPHSTIYNPGGVDQNRKKHPSLYGSGLIIGEDYRDSVAVAVLILTGQDIISFTQVEDVYWEDTA